MTEWTGSSPAQLEISLMAFDELVAAVDERAASDAVAATPIVGGFSLAASISAAEQMQWFADVNPGCIRFTGGSYLGGGYVEGPDGARYPIVVPRVETAEGQVYTADRHDTAPGEPSIATLAGSDPGWEVVACASGVERFQAAPSLLERGLGAIAATTGRVGPLPPNAALTAIAMPINSPPYFDEVPTTPLPAAPRASGGGPDTRPPTPGDIVAGAVGLGDHRRPERRPRAQPGQPERTRLPGHLRAQRRRASARQGAHVPASLRRGRRRGDRPRARLRQRRRRADGAADPLRQRSTSADGVSITSASGDVVVISLLRRRRRSRSR